jgi:hypothetical protein
MLMHSSLSTQCIVATSHLHTQPLQSKYVVGGRVGHPRIPLQHIVPTFSLTLGLAFFQIPNAIGRCQDSTFWSLKFCTVGHMTRDS